MPDMDDSCLTFYIGVFQMAEFIEAHTGSVKDGDGEVSLWIVKGVKKTPDQLPVRDKRKISVELMERYLRAVPGLMEHIDPEKLEVRNNHVDGAVGKAAFRLYPFQERADNIPWNILRGKVQSLKISKERLQIGLIISNRIVRKVSGLKHLNKNR